MRVVHYASGQYGTYLEGFSLSKGENKLSQKSIVSTVRVIRDGSAQLSRCSLIYIYYYICDTAKLLEFFGPKPTGSKSNPSVERGLRELGGGFRVHLPGLKCCTSAQHSQSSPEKKSSESWEPCFEESKLQNLTRARFVQSRGLSEVKGNAQTINCEKRSEWEPINPAEKPPFIFFTPMYRFNLGHSFFWKK